jgi:D-alanyl-D-alanine dipeptidase
MILANKLTKALTPMSPPFPDLRAKPLPDLLDARERRAQARSWPIERTSPAHSEPLVTAGEFGLNGQNYYASRRNPPYYSAAPGAIDTLLLRKGVADRLARANERLRPQGLHLFLFDAWRPRAVQEYFHDFWAPREISRRRPELAGESLVAEVERYWAPPSPSDSRPAPHATGGAVDLTVVWSDGQPLWMGSLFDDVTALAHTDRFERVAGADFSFSDEEARANRRLLYWVMTDAGFANHPDEWWHYSYGDQTWAALTGQKAALYGLIENP